MASTGAPSLRDAQLRKTAVKPDGAREQENVSLIKLKKPTVPDVMKINTILHTSAQLDNVLTSPIMLTFAANSWLQPTTARSGSTTQSKRFAHPSHAMVLSNTARVKTQLLVSSAAQAPTCAIMNVLLIP
jgi:hypothetical protein